MIFERRVLADTEMQDLVEMEVRELLVESRELLEATILDLA